MFNTKFSRLTNITGIYMISFKDKQYIGSSINIENRVRAHRSALRKGEHPNILLQRYYDKYGEDNWSYEILHTFSCSDIKWVNYLRAVEFYFIEIYDPFFNIKNMFEESKYMSRGRPAHNRVKTYQYNLDGNYITEYNSSIEAAENTNCINSAVSACIRGEVHSAGGYRWSSKKLDKLPPMKKKYITTTVHKFTMNGKYLETFASIKEAAISIGIKSPSNIVSVCNGKQKSCKGFRWSYYR